MIEKGFEIKCLDKGFVRYIDHLGSDQRIVESARISYKSPSKGDEQDKKLLNYLYKNNHGSPFEMGKITFNIKMPIFIMRQYIRHRMQNVNEMSGRYTELPKDFYIPTKWRVQDTKNKQGSVDSDFLIHKNISIGFEQWCDEAYRHYEELLELGIAKEMARMILPLNIYTEFYTTWDIRNLFNFFRLRDDSHAQLEIQEYSNAMKQITRELFPWSMEAYDKYKLVLQEINHEN